MSKDKKSALKVHSSENHHSETPKKLDPKMAVCKEDNCSDRAQVAGFCRLHFLKLVKNAKAEDNTDDQGKPKKAWNRRRGNRASGFEQSVETIENPTRDGIIQQLGALDDDFGTILETEELAPFKKTG